MASNWFLRTFISFPDQSAVCQLFTSFIWKIRVTQVRKNFEQVNSLAAKCCWNVFTNSMLKLYWMDPNSCTKVARMSRRSGYVNALPIRCVHRFPENANLCVCRVIGHSEKTFFFRPIDSFPAVNFHSIKLDCFKTFLYKKNTTATLFHWNVSIRSIQKSWTVGQISW